MLLHYGIGPYQTVSPLFEIPIFFEPLMPEAIKRVDGETQYPAFASARTAMFFRAWPRW